MKTFAYLRPSSADEAASALRDRSARPMGGGTDLLTQLDRGIRPADSVVDLRGLGLDEISPHEDGLAIGATVRVADLLRDPRVTGSYAGLATAAASAASPQLREMGTVAGNLCQQPRCWYFRHPDLRCWLRGGDTCYAQIGDHRKHGLEPGDCISVAPSDLSAPLLAMGARVETNERAAFPIAELYRRPSEDDRTTVTLTPGEFITRVLLPPPSEASSYARAGERHAWSFALVAVAADRRDGDVSLAAIGVSNIPRLLDPADPLAGLPGLEMTTWKRRLLAGLVDDAVAAL
jgi:xanthine dehydrogenase YagS FAD-binding subunit